MTERKLRKLILSSVPIETERLIIRYITIDDAYDMYEYASLPQVCQYLLWYPHVNLEATEGYIESLQKRYAKGLYADWAVELKSEQKMIGTVGFASIDTSEGSCELGYVLSPKYTHHGYMTEALNAVMELAFKTLRFEKLTLRIISENATSIKLAEHNGFSVSYYSKLIVKDEERDIVNFVLHKSEYKK